MTTTLAAPPSAPAQVLCDHQREILARIDRGGLAICEAELRHKLRWNEARLGSLLDVLADLEASGLLESAVHFRLTDRGRAELPADYHPPVRAGSGTRGQAHERRQGEKWLALVRQVDAVLAGTRGGSNAA